MLQLNLVEHSKYFAWVCKAKKGRHGLSEVPLCTLYGGASKFQRCICGYFVGSFFFLHSDTMYNIRTLRSAIHSVNQQKTLDRGGGTR